ncbi:MAG: hypothetical protein QG602_427 [Verrucomicrobiota bacterium]|nr:hypothetical protein [Verrucomicrobiota bacterium]
MNRGTITGGVVTQAASAYTAPTFAAPSVRRVVFKIATRDSRGGSAFWNCEAESPAQLLDFLETRAEPGQGIKVEYELAARPFYKRGVLAGEARFLRVLAAEIEGVRVPAVREAVPA